MTLGRYRLRSLPPRPQPFVEDWSVPFQEGRPHPDRHGY